MTRAEKCRLSSMARYRRLKSEGRCTCCGKKKEPGDDYARCSDCREFRRAKNCNGIQDAKSKVLAERIEFIARNSSLPAMKQAKALGVPVNSIYWLRNLARKEGHDIPRDYGGALTRTSSKWADIDNAGLVNERCRCGLLSPCNSCLPAHADGSVRRGPGAVYPESFG